MHLEDTRLRVDGEDDTTRRLAVRQDDDRDTTSSAGCRREDRVSHASRAPRFSHAVVVVALMSTSGQAVKAPLGRILQMLLSQDEEWLVRLWLIPGRRSAHDAAES